MSASEQILLYHRKPGCIQTFFRTRLRNMTFGVTLIIPIFLTLFFDYFGRRAVNRKRLLHAFFFDQLVQLLEKFSIIPLNALNILDFRHPAFLPTFRSTRLQSMTLGVTLINETALFLECSGREAVNNCISCGGCGSRSWHRGLKAFVLTRLGSMVPVLHCSWHSLQPASEREHFL